MAMSNSTYLQVTPVALEATGWQVRVLDYRDFTTTVAVIPEFIALSAGPELNAPGAGSVTLDADSPWWQTVLRTGEPASSLLANEYLWEAWEDGVRRFQWFGRNVQEKLVDGGDALSRQITVSGPGNGESLRWAKIMPPGFPNPVPPGTDENAVGYTNDVPKRGWEFPLQWPAMRMWWTMFKAAQSRGTVPWVKPTFTELVDSAGALWEYIPTNETAAGQGHRVELGGDLLDFLNECTGQDYSKHFAERVEWVMWPGFVLEARKTIGIHREDQVVFYEAALHHKERTRAREEIANYVVVVDAYGSFSVASDSASVSQWNKRESYENRNQNITEPSRREAIAQTYLEQRKDEKSEWVITLPYDQPGRRPFRDFNLGDWVGVASHTPSATVIEVYRVLAIVVNIADDAATVEVTLQSKLEYRQRQLEAQLTTLINQVNNVNVTMPGTPPIPPYPDPNSGTYPYPYPSPGSVSPGAGPGTDPTAGMGMGVRVFIQDTEPADARPGDFWYDTTYTPPAEPVDPVVPEPDKPVVDPAAPIPNDPDNPTRWRVPNTHIWFE